MMNMINKAFPTKNISFSESMVVEIGSGAVGMVAFLNAAKRYAIDPLCDYYTSKPELVEHRNPNVVYQTGKGEDLPYPDCSVDLVIIENVIDHVQNANQVMREIYRILKPNGILYLTVNLHPAWGAFLHRIIAALKIDRGHPYTFTISKIRQFLAGHQFKISHCEWESYKECRRKDYSSSHAKKDKIKAIVGLSEFLFTAVSRKE